MFHHKKRLGSGIPLCLGLALIWQMSGPTNAEAISKKQIGSAGASNDKPTARTVQVKEDHTVVHRAPTRRAPRIGVVMKDTRLSVMTTRKGPGCGKVWYQVHREGWVCGKQVRPSTDLPAGRRYPVVPTGEIVPWPYAFVFAPTVEYRLREDLLTEARSLRKGFGFGVAKRTKIENGSYFQTTEGNFVPREAAGISAKISQFSGIRINPDSPWPVGFVTASKAWVYSSPARDNTARIGQVDRYTAFQAVEETGKGRHRFVRFDDGAWFSKRDVRVATKAPLPKELEPGNKWIDVDTREQILIAYEGQTPVYITLVSTGRPGESRTRKGSFRIWAKVAAIHMDNTNEELEAGSLSDSGTDPDNLADTGQTREEKLYSLHDVPWAQFFLDNYGLHGVYWHDHFGHRRSHGCVNMSPKDARWIFNWTEPQLPNGWWAVHESPSSPGTIVRVR